MARRRFFVDSVRQSRAVLRGDDARHLRQVLRAEVGERYEISDNAEVYLAEIDGFGRDEVSFRVLEPVAANSPAARVALFLALVKFDRFEWALEKATELGADRVVPVRAERSEKGLELGALKRLERWRKIVREASQQARRPRLPEVVPPVSFEDAVAAGSGARYFLDEEPGAPALSASRESEAALLVGPEGGWTVRERAFASENGWMRASLGPLILRTETAAVAGLALLLSAARD